MGSIVIDAGAAGVCAGTPSRAPTRVRRTRGPSDDGGGRGEGGGLSVAWPAPGWPAVVGGKPGPRHRLDRGLVEAVFTKWGHRPWGTTREKAGEALSKWVRGQKDRPGKHEWLAQATGTVFELQDPGRLTSKTNPYAFRRKPIS